MNKLVEPASTRKLTADEQALSARHVGMAFGVAKATPTHLEFADAAQEGSIGLMEAAKTFQEDRGTAFSAMAKKRVRGAILDAAKACGPSIVHVPWQERARTQREHGHMSERSSVSINRKSDAGNFLFDRARKKGMRASEKNFRSDFWIAVERLSSREQHIVRRRCEGLDLQEIGSELGLSKSRISRLFDSIATQIREIMGCEAGNKFHVNHKKGGGMTEEKLRPLTDDQHELVASHLMLAERLAKKWRYRLDRDDALQASYLSLIRSALTFRPEEGATFSTHAENCIKGFLVSEWRGRSLVQVPRDNKAQKSPEAAIAFAKTKPIPVGVSHTIDMDDKLDLKHYREQFYFALARLTEGQRKVMIHRSKGATLKETAAAMGFNDRRAGALEAQARNNLRKMLPIKPERAIAC